MNRWMIRILVLLFAVAGVTLPAPELHARNYSMFDKTSGAELVVIGRVLKVKTKAVIQVDRVLKGAWDDETLEVRFRAGNYDRRQIGVEKIQFFEGERLLLFLKPKDERAGRKGKFLLYPEDPRGRLDLHDDEVARLAAEAVTACVEATFTNRRELREVWIGMARQRNVFIRLCGLESLEYDRALGPEHFPLLAALYHDRYPVIRTRALQLTSVVARLGGMSFRESDEREILLDEAMTLLDDREEAVRVEAVRVMQYLGDRQLIPRLRTIGATDSSQEVRLEATRILFQEETNWLEEGEE
jgi:hypothetical protein